LTTIYNVCNAPPDGAQPAWLAQAGDCAGCSTRTLRCKPLPMLHNQSARIAVVGSQVHTSGRQVDPTQFEQILISLCAATIAGVGAI
jgi:hypothetical protein